ncbi:transcription factor NDT80 [Lachancea thermotolerans CBS 6340]|uniref:KLTH0B05544p n=1 Tax=Lachancea thermotolerans (strain ATCC 56472 / CBS 6340 / NRRL Y-8284) TaxID=559295 RepID=C5DCT0_LACTC|nr:KLTH0B05544p [Lachancea thermotolerans CBS 6340]CAR21591.1 KLTH0B05544p [Lachancea thermotolerans CBS 6340]
MPDDANEETIQEFAYSLNAEDGLKDIAGGEVHDDLNEAIVENDSRGKVENSGGSERSAQQRRTGKRRKAHGRMRNFVYNQESSSSRPHCRGVLSAKEKSENNVETITHEDGSTSNYFDKRRLKIAPRSTLQFKIGPSFETVGRYCQVLGHRDKRPVNFMLRPRIDRGFDHIEDEWIGYKRNYFTLVTSFEVESLELPEFLNQSFEVDGVSGASSPLRPKYFAVRLMAVCDEDESQVSLVQHTAKRDKGPQFEPPILALVPATLPSHQIIREASNVRNESKMKKYDSLFFFYRNTDAQEFAPESVVHSYPKDRIKKVARYERVQFSSSINAKKQPNQCKHFKLRVVLGCVVDGQHLNQDSFCAYQGLDCLVENGTGTFVPILEMETPPLVIRGRSPSNYSAALATPSPKRAKACQNSISATRNSGPGKGVPTCGPLTRGTPRAVFKASEFQDSNEDGMQKRRGATKPLSFSSSNLKPSASVKTPDSNMPKKTPSSLTFSEKRLDMQTMSSIEAVMMRHLPHILERGSVVEGLDLLSKHCSDSSYTIGMRDIELTPFLLGTPQDFGGHHSTSGFESDVFGLGMSPEPAHPHSPSNACTIRETTKQLRPLRERKLNNKPASMDITFSGKPSSTNNDEATECTFSENSYQFHATINAKSSRGTANVPRSVEPNPMDISFRLNMGTDSASMPRPISNTGLASRRMLTASGKPSDIFGASELFDEPSFYRH